MFTTAVLITVALILYLTIHNWVVHHRLSTRAVHKQLKRIEQLLAIGEVSQGEKELAPILEQSKGGKEGALLDIQILRANNKHEQALKRAIWAGRRYPEDLCFRLEEGKLRLALGQPEEALDVFRVCNPIIRSRGDFLALSTALHQTGQSEEALRLIQPHLKNNQNHEFSQLAGDIFYHLKQFQAAIAHYYRALELSGPSHKIWMQLAHAYRRLGNLAEAEKIFRQLLEKDSSDIAATLGLGACFQERGHHQKALLIFQSGAAWESGHTDLIREAAHCALRLKKYALAERYFFTVLQKQKHKTPDLCACYGYALERQHKWREAEAFYLQMIQQFPSHYQGYRALAWLFGVGLAHSLDQLQALSYAHIALKLKNVSTSWEILSACEARVGHFDKAYQIQESLALQDTDKHARFRRQQALRALRNHHPLDDHHVIHSLVA